LLKCLRYWCLSNGFSNITADISPFCAVVAVSKIDILVCDISLMNLMDECTLFACWIIDDVDMKWRDEEENLESSPHQPSPVLDL
jgi:hypothetical protein